MLSWQRANEKKVLTKYPGMSAVSFFLVGFDHFFFCKRFWDVYICLVISKLKKTPVSQSCHKLLSWRNIFRNTEIHVKKILKSFIYQKCYASNQKWTWPNFLGRMHWTVFTPRWYRTPHSSYIQNNHVYRIIPLKQRKKNEPIIKLAVLKSSLNFEFCYFTNNTIFFLPLFFVSYLSIIALNVQSERAHNLQTG